MNIENPEIRSIRDIIGNGIGVDVYYSQSGEPFNSEDEDEPHINYSLTGSITEDMIANGWPIDVIFVRDGKDIIPIFSPKTSSYCHSEMFKGINMLLRREGREALDADKDFVAKGTIVVDNANNRAQTDIYARSTYEFPFRDHPVISMFALKTGKSIEHTFAEDTVSLISNNGGNTLLLTYRDGVLEQRKMRSWV